MINLTKKVYIMALFMVVLLAICLFYFTSMQTSTQNKSNILGEATGLTIHQFNNRGIIHYIGTAEKGIRYTNENTALTDIALTVFNQNRTVPPWHLKADHALVLNQNQQINLNGHVVIIRNKHQHARAIQLQTAKLQLYTNTHIAKSDQKVWISEPHTQNVTSATGMVANWQALTAHLLTKVVSIYDPKKSH